MRIPRKLVAAAAITLAGCYPQGAPPLPGVQLSVPFHWQEQELYCGEANIQADLPTALQISMWLKDPHGNYIAYANDARWGYYLSLQLGPNVEETGTYTCEAHYWGGPDLEYLGMDEATFSVKLKAYEIQIDAFIPEDNVAHPFMSDRVYKGDDRPEWFKFGDFRTREWLKIIGPRATVYLIDEGPYPDTGPTSVYEASSSLDAQGRLTGEALSDWIRGSPLKIDWDQASPSGLDCSTSKLSASEMRVSCDGNVANPLVWSWAQWGASITYHLEVRLTFSGDGNVYYEVTGDHDGFPNYGIWVGDQRIYDYYHGSQTPWSLGPPMEMPAYRSGVLQ